MTQRNVHTSALAAIIGLGIFASPAISAASAFQRPYLRDAAPQAVTVGEPEGDRMGERPPPMSFGEFLCLLELAEEKTGSVDDGRPAAEEEAGGAETDVDGEASEPERTATVHRVSTVPVFLRQDGLFDPYLPRIVTIGEILPLFIRKEPPGTLGLPSATERALPPVPFRPPHAKRGRVPFSSPEGAGGDGS